MSCKISIDQRDIPQVLGMAGCHLFVVSPYSTWVSDGVSVVQFMVAEEFCRFVVVTFVMTGVAATAAMTAKNDLQSK